LRLCVKKLDQHERDATRAEAQEVGSPVGRRGRQHRAVHRWPQRQRSALPRLRYPRHRRAMRVRGNRASAGAREIAHPDGTRRIQGQAQVAAWPAGDGEGNARADSRLCPSHGRTAHRLLHARHGGPGKERPPCRGRSRHRRPPDRLLRLDAALLAPLQPGPAPDRSRDR